MGVPLTATGGLIALLGGTIHGSSTSHSGSGPDMNILANNIVKAFVVFGGGAIAAVGISAWIYGAVEKAHFKKMLAKFPAKVTLSPNIFRDLNHYSLGLSVALRF